MKEIKYYHHVCNGGPTLSVFIPENRKDIDTDTCRLEVNEGYEDYSHTRWSFYHPTPAMLRKWADVMLEAARILENQTPEQFDEKSTVK